MLMDILMESLMAMDDDSLEYVIESCSDEELEIIDNMVTEKAYSNVKRVVGNIFHGPEKTNEEIIKHGRSDEKDAATYEHDSAINDVNRKKQDYKRAAKDLISARHVQAGRRDGVRAATKELREAKKSGDINEIYKREQILQSRLNTLRNDKIFTRKPGDNIAHDELSHDDTLTGYKNTLKRLSSESKHFDEDITRANKEYESKIDQINKANAEDVERNNNSRSAAVGRVLQTPVSQALGKITNAINNKQSESNTSRNKSKA